MKKIAEKNYEKVGALPASFADDGERKAFLQDILRRKPQEGLLMIFQEGVFLVSMPVLLPQKQSL